MRLWDVIGVLDRKQFLEVMPNAKPRQNPIGVRVVCARENQFSAWERSQGQVQFWIGRKQGDVDVMNKIKIVLGVGRMVGHHAAQGAAMIAVVLAPYVFGRTRFEIECAGHEFGDSRADLLEETALRRIERVVEIENPLVDMLDCREIRSLNGF